MSRVPGCNLVIGERVNWLFSWLQRLKKTFSVFFLDLIWLRVIFDVFHSSKEVTGPARIQGTKIQCLPLRGISWTAALQRPWVEEGVERSGGVCNPAQKVGVL